MNQELKVKIKIGIALCVSFIVIPHIIAYFISKRKDLIDDEVRTITSIRLRIKISTYFGLLYLLIYDIYFRNYFYYRLGSISIMFRWWLPGCKYFILPDNQNLGKGFRYAHPYGSILNAKSIGNNFSCLHLTTIGKLTPGADDKPTILDNVTLGANVTIIGEIFVGNNVIIGAGSVITKNIPDNCIVVGNPARIIMKNNIKVNEKL